MLCVIHPAAAGDKNEMPHRRLPPSFNDIRSAFCIAGVAASG
jgi:hypothetical protein